MILDSLQIRLADTPDPKEKATIQASIGALSFGIS
jgi:hypothetical protein